MKWMSKQEQTTEEVTDRIFTLANIISFIRLSLVPIFFVLLLNGHDFSATLLFAIAASTDWVDGQVARKTHTVSKLGQLLDPAVDRILIITGVIGLLIVGRLPIWIVVLVLARDLLLLIGGGVLLIHYKTRVPVVYLGKVASTFIYIGFAGVLLNWPLVPGLALCDLAWLPGFSGFAVSWGIWFVYIGLALAIVTTTIYVIHGLREIKEIKAQNQDEAA